MENYKYHNCICPKCKNEVKAVLTEKTCYVRPKGEPARPYTKLAYACPKCGGLFTTFDLRDENNRRISRALKNW